MKWRIDAWVWLGFGLAVVIFLSATGYALWRSDLFVDKETIELRAATGAGLSRGMEVKYSGFTIGRVEQMRLTDNGMVSVELSVPTREMRWLRVSSRFELRPSLLGSPHIEIITPDLSAAEFSRDRIIDLIVPDLVGDLQTQATEIFERVQGLVVALTDPENPARLEVLVANANQLMANLVETTDRLNEGESLMDFITGEEGSGREVAGILRNFHALTEEVTPLMAEANLLVSDLRLQLAGQAEAGTVYSLNAVLDTVVERLQDLQPTLDNLAKMTGEVARVSESLEVMRDQVMEAVARTNSMLQRVQSLPIFGGSGTDTNIELP